MPPRTGNDILDRICNELASDLGDLDISQYADFEIIQPVESCSTTYHCMTHYAFKYKYKERTISVWFDGWSGSTGHEQNFYLAQKGKKKHRSEGIIRDEDLDPLYDALRKPIESGERSVTKILEAASVDKRAYIWVALFASQMLAYFEMNNNFDDEGGESFIWSDTTWNFGGLHISFEARV